MDKIICLGKNYSLHTKEMKEEQPTNPVLFIKPPSTLICPKENSSVQLPWERGIIHHECEIVFKLYKKNIIALGLGLDLTLRDLQKDLKSKGHPWEISKTFKNSAILSPLKGLKDFPKNWQDLSFELKVNHETKQMGKLSEAYLNADQIIHYVDQYFPICDGDLIFTGTPHGVGSLKKGDLLELNFGPIHHRIRVI